MSKLEIDFRQRFATMAPQAIISRGELAVLLQTTEGGISQMIYRGELPKTAFPNKRKCCWFVQDIRDWLDMNLRKPPFTVAPQALSGTPKTHHALKKIGRPRSTIDYMQRD